MSIKKCFAYNIEGLRCMQAAGHDGDHAHAITWTDEECFAPFAVAVPLAQQEPEYTAFPASEQAADTTRCVACSHKVSMHPTGECLSCDCKGVIPE